MKKGLGREKIEVIDSIPYSQLIFLVASGKNYALSIAEARGKEDSSPTAKQLKQLKKRGFLKSEKNLNNNLLNKTLYSINWNLIIEKLAIELKRSYKDMIEEDRLLNSNWKSVLGSKVETLNLLENKDFIERLKNNSYLQEFFKEYFSSLAKLRENNITEAFTYLVFFGDLNILTTAKPNIEGISYFIEGI